MRQASTLQRLRRGHGYLIKKGDRMTELVLDAFVTAVIAASDYEEMDRIYLKTAL